MGNNFICNNYYCQDISYKPEWFSETSWIIDYIHTNSNKKPYNIDKGIISINNVNSFNILFSKKLLIDFNEIKNITIPLNVDCNILNNITLIIIFSNKQITLNEINNNDFLIININLFNKKNIFKIDLENNLNMLYVTENINNNIIKYFKSFNLNENNEYYLNIYINNQYIFNNEEFITLYID